MVGPFDPVPRMYAALVCVCLGALAIGLVAAAVVSVDVVVRAPAVVRPASDGSTVRNATPGAVVQKSYVQGQRVAEGDVLWSIDEAAAEVDRASSLAQKRRLDDEATQWAVYADSLEAGQNLVSPRFIEAYHRAASYFSEARRLDLVAADLERRWDRENRLPSELRMPQKVGDLESSWRQAVLDAERFRSTEQERLASDRRALRLDQEAVDRRLADLEKRLDRAVVRAPIAGTVEDLRPFNVHDYLTEGEAVVRIVPAAGTLKLDLRVDPRDVAEVKVGQRVITRFAGLPPSRFGPVGATISRVSADSVVVDGTLAAFSAEASLDQVIVEDRAGRHLNLKPGMSADGRIVVARRPALTLLLETLEFLE